MSPLFWNLMHDAIQEMRYYLRDGYEPDTPGWSDDEDTFEIPIIDITGPLWEPWEEKDRFCFSRLPGESDQAAEERFDNELPEFIERWGY